MKNTNKKLISTVVISLLATSVSFADTPVSDAYSPGESDSKWIVGGGLAVWENHYINEGDSRDSDDDEYHYDDGEYDGTFIPRVEYRGERFFIDDEGLGLTVFRSNGFSTGLILGGDYTYLSDEDEYDDNDRLEGIEERDATANLGLYLLHNHENGQVKATIWQEISDKHDGQSFDLRYSYNFPIGERWNVTPTAGVRWASDDTINHFYGVSEQESIAANDIAAYTGKSTTSVFGGVSARFDINDHWDLTFGAAAVSFGDGIADSPLVKDDNTLISGFGVNYNF